MVRTSRRLPLGYDLLPARGPEGLRRGASFGDGLRCSKRCLLRRNTTGFHFRRLSDRITSGKHLRGHFFSWSVAPFSLETGSFVSPVLPFFLSQFYTGAAFVNRLTNCGVHGLSFLLTERRALL